MTRLGARALGLALTLSTQALAQDGGTRESVLSVPGPSGTQLNTRLCVPERAGAAPLVIVNHGSPGNAAARAGMEPWRCTSGVARYFLRRGYAVAFPQRRGYGVSSGGWAEAYGSCTNPDYAAAGRRGAEDIAAVLNHLRSLPGIARTGTLIIGHSAGGWASIAFAARNPAGVSGVVNVAGGRGGQQPPGPGVVGSNCTPDALVSGVRRFASARVPTLWLYTRNDSFFAPELAEAMFASFRAGGGNGRMVMLPAYGSDGHALFSGGGEHVWGPPISSFMSGLR